MSAKQLTLREQLELQREKLKSRDCVGYRRDLCYKEIQRIEAILARYKSN